MQNDITCPNKNSFEGPAPLWNKISLASGNYRQGRNHTGGGYDKPTNTLFGSDAGVDTIARPDGLDAWAR